MTYPELVKFNLWSVIHKMPKSPGKFAKNLDADFTRNRKLDFENLLRFLIVKESDNTASELLKYIRPRRQHYFQFRFLSAAEKTAARGAASPELNGCSDDRIIIIPAVFFPP